MPTDFRLYKQYDAKFDGSEKCPSGCYSGGTCPFILNEEIMPCCDEYPYLECVYDVTTTTSPTTLYHDKPIANLFLMKIDDDLAITGRTGYTFSTTGEHRVRFYQKTPITGVSQYAFYGCNRLVSCNVPDTVNAIGNPSNNIGYSFNDCTILSEVKLPKGIKTIYPYSFHNCFKLEKIIIQNNIETIKDSGFGVCSGCTELYLADSVKTIGAWAFNQMTSLKKITIDAVTPPSVGASCFYLTDNVEHVYVPPQSVNAYKNAAGWNKYASIIQANPYY